ncbi:hypothetical protein HELRODRAFT_80823, partial [Helobdella robusta]|uniref:Fibrinogen C-terminal domain-containing protein n=1 Tax=Helobdella robusta TaxID=6412 RepID=T1G460_HELRO
DCSEVRSNGFTTSSVYKITIGKNALLEVFCEIDRENGWTVIQRRIDGSTNFNRKWKDYKQGFGNLFGEFWLGNENIHLITRRRKYEMYIEMKDFDNNIWFANYGYFQLDSSSNKYKITVRDYKGTSGDSMSYNDQMYFSTSDFDNDHDMKNCASEKKSGWWFQSCSFSNLNGIYHIENNSMMSEMQTPDGISWYTIFESEYYSLKNVVMKIKPSNEG